MSNNPTPNAPLPPVLELRAYLVARLENGQPVAAGPMSFDSAISSLGQMDSRERLLSEILPVTFRVDRGWLTKQLTDRYGILANELAELRNQIIRESN